ncbi:MAG: bifunctional diguanylate cyclase/phosphodiesterase, partial [Acidimicrobiales bacterium]|nr:bifunctional diguanylate cyclase/phosphodiesterase [Acidimicrobiales bacterium]
LDGFKRVNDIYGFGVGDQLMKEVADRIKAVLGPRDNLVRYGGDEFVVLCPEVTNATSAERITKSIIKAIEAPIEHDGDIVQLSASIGIALTEERCSRPDEVLRDADAAMYQAKALGPGRYALFDRSVRDQVTPAIAERRLRQALENGEFRLYYQPIVSLWTKRLVGVEALLRWSDPERGMVRPEEFVPALEETGLIVPIGDWIINEVCKQSREWTELYPDRPPLNIKFNVSPRQLAQANFVEHVRLALAASGAAPERICLEVSEAALMHDVSAAWSTLQACKQLGVSLALDDFGAGFSSLAYLRQLKLDLLTIDKSFVDELTHSREDAVIVEHVIGMAKALGIVTVAEGVETEEQVGVLRSLNCDLAQGYYFSHPQPPDVIAYLMERHANRQEWRPPHKTDEEATHAPSAPVVVLEANREPTNDAATANPDDGSLPPRRTRPAPR